MKDLESFKNLICNMRRITPEDKIPFSILIAIINYYLGEMNG
jgi:hypothetical protein